MIGGLDRRLLVPETIQTSATDCGPAALHALLAGCGLRSPYERLREICCTDVDGTSPSALAALAGDLGLEVEETMVPLDHVAVAGVVVLPAIAIVRRPNGLRHFVVVWRRHGRFLQVMDPAVGRRWLTVEAFLGELYVHQVRVPADGWREFAGEELVGALRRRYRHAGVGQAVGAGLLRSALADESWRSLAALDAGVRMLARLRRGGLVRSGRPAEALLARAFESARAAGSRSVPASCWSVTPVSEGADGPEALEMTGVVLLEVKGRRPAPAQPAPPPVSRPSAGKTPTAIGSLLRAEGRAFLVLLLAGAGVASAATLLQVVLFRRVYDVSLHFGLKPQLLGVLVALATFLGTLFLTELALHEGSARLGRRLEGRIRLRLLESLPRLGDGYFRSRLVSDLADRAHHAHVVHGLPQTIAELAVRAFSILFTVAGIALIAPGSAVVAVLAAGLLVALPFLAGGTVFERELRQRTHHGTLARGYLDALRGLMPLQAHGAYRSVRHEHRTTLVEWTRAGLHALRASTAFEAAQGLVGVLFAAWLLVDHLGDQREILAGGFLLLMFWALQLPVLGQSLASLVRTLLSARYGILRLEEPIRLAERAEVAPEATPERATPRRSGVGIGLEGVSVAIGGARVLRNLQLAIEPGTHVAVVGRSGAGKTSLLGLLLGWYRPSAGQLLVDGRPLAEADLEALRRRTAWVDPSIQLWNRSLLENLLYAAPSQPEVPLGRCLEEADLASAIERLPDGLQTRLGEAGALLSGGEGQRIRLGRALMGGQASLVLLDEPFRGLDRERRRVLLGRARHWWRGATLLCVTHDVEETTRFGRVLVMENGTIVEDGPPAVLLADPSSRYGRLLRAEAAVHRELWQREGWRRLRCEGKRLVEADEPAEVAEPRLRRVP